MLIDYPDREVPDGLAHAGHEVWIKGGPGETDYVRQDVVAGEIVARSKKAAPISADLIYIFRPLDELPNLLGLAKRLRARMIWYQSGYMASGERTTRGCWLSPADASYSATLAREAGMEFVWDKYILDMRA